ncbi:MAG: aspartate kinase [Clostridia bacterium]|nr:aspartate kinase [Clostridia bacterium]
MVFDNDKPKVVKFGGTSLADHEQFRKVKAIIDADETRRYAVPSAPGKRRRDDIKITDMLYECFELSEDEKPIDEIFSKITERYDEIIEELGLDLDLSANYKDIKTAIENHAGRDYAASRGEYLSALILSKLTGFHFIDAARVIKFKDDGTFDGETTQTLLSKKLSEHYRAVIPGFYGSMPNGTIKTFSRGGSDVTGAIVAKAAAASVYENWTDVSGFLMADPRVVDDPETIKLITYRELRELCYMGASVLHEDSVFPVRSAGIPINIRNTNAPDHEGTLIVPSCPDYDRDKIITGIAGKKGFSLISVEKDMFHSEKGVARKVLTIIERENLNFEHMPTGIDTMSVIVSGDADERKKERIKAQIIDEVSPDSISYEDGLALIAVVGRGMVQNKGTAAKIFKACAENGINIRMIDQGSSEINVIIGVADIDFAKACRAIYAEFVKN